MATKSFRQAINEALAQEMRRDRTIVVIGEDVSGGLGAPGEQDAWGGHYPPAEAGQWHDAWSEPLQSRWLREFYNIALSKPFVESISWRDLADAGEHYLPHGGLLRADLSPKLAYEQLCTIRAQIHADGQSPQHVIP